MIGEQLGVVRRQLEVKRPMTLTANSSAVSRFRRIIGGMQVALCPDRIDRTEMVGTEQDLTAGVKNVSY